MMKRDCLRGLRFDKRIAQASLISRQVNFSKDVAGLFIHCSENWASSSGACTLSDEQQTFSQYDSCSCRETGRIEAISQVSKWSATWHHSHIYEPDVAPLLPTGAVLVLKQWYDNTSDNPHNPDPDQNVVWGSRTGDDMNHAWIAVTHLDEEGFEKLVEERKENEQRSVAGFD